MQEAIFVWPLQLLTSIYRVVGVNQNESGFSIENHVIEVDGEVRDRLTVKIHCETELVPCGRVDLEVSGDYSRGFE